MKKVITVFGLIIIIGVLSVLIYDFNKKEEERQQVQVKSVDAQKEDSSNNVQDKENSKDTVDKTKTEKKEASNFLDIHNDDSKLNKKELEEKQEKLLDNNKNINKFIEDKKEVKDLRIVDFTVNNEKKRLEYIIKNEGSKEYFLDNTINYIDPDKNQVYSQNKELNEKKVKLVIKPGETKTIFDDKLKENREEFKNKYNSTLNLLTFKIYKPVYNEYESNELAGVLTYKE